MLASFGLCKGSSLADGFASGKFPLQLPLVVDASIDRGTVEEALERTGLAKPQRPGV